jgi:20S proteasome alpha/beta subunit
MINSAVPELAGLTTPGLENSIDNNFLPGRDKMTLITAMKVKEAIVVATDSRGLVGTDGAYNDTQKKIEIINDLVIGIFGTGDLGLFLKQANRDALENPQSSIDLVAKSLSHGLLQVYSQLFGGLAVEQRPFVGFILAGYRKRNPSLFEPAIYTLKNPLGFGPELSGNSPTFGGYSQVAEYLSSQCYTASLSIEKAICLSTYMITETSSWTANVGGRPHVFKIEPNTRPIEVEEKKIDEVIQSNNEINQTIKEFFNPKIS